MQDAVRDALTRLCNEGLDRHEALHALGSVLAEHMLGLAKGTPGTSDGTAEHHAKLAALLAARWRDSARTDPGAAEPDAGGGQDRTAEAGTHRQGEAHRPLSETELDRLSAFLSSLKNPDAMNLEALDGFLCALIAGPDLVMPSEYLPLIWGGELPDENAFSSLEEASALLQLIMRHWNSIIAELEKTAVHFPLVEAPDERGVPGRAWARGFMRGVRLSTSAGWTELFTDESEGSLLTIPIVAGEVDPAWPPEPLSADKAEDMLAGMGAGLARAYRHFAAHRRAAAQAVRRQATYRRSTRKVGTAAARGAARRAAEDVLSAHTDHEPAGRGGCGPSLKGQLDLFVHSRTVILLNDLIDSLLEHNSARGRERLQLLRAEAPGHPALDALGTLCEALERWPVATTGAGDTARVVEWLDSEVARAAGSALGTSAPTFMRSLWRALAVSVASQSYDPAHPRSHCACCYLRAGDAPAALEALATIRGRDLDPFIL